MVARTSLSVNFAALTSDGGDDTRKYVARNRQ